MGEEEPPRKRTRQNDGLPAAAPRLGPRDIQMKIEDNPSGGKRIIIEHPSLSSGSSYSVQAGEAEWILFCGNLQYVPTNVVFFSLERCL